MGAELLEPLATPDPELTISVAETARRLGIGRDLAWQLVHAGEIPSLRLGRRVVVPVDQLHDWIRRRARDDTPDGAAR